MTSHPLVYSAHKQERLPTPDQTVGIRSHQHNCGFGAGPLGLAAADLHHLRGVHYSCRNCDGQAVVNESLL